MFARCMMIAVMLASATATAQQTPPTETPSTETPSSEKAATPPAEPAPAAPPAAETPAQPQSEATVAPPPSEEMALDEWDRDDWSLVKPSLSLFEVKGYFRVRADAFRRLDFGNYAGVETSLTDVNQLVSRYPAASNGDANFTGTNMRLRLEPTINITEQVQLVVTADVFDNLQLGSTPESLPPIGDATPVNALAGSQRAPTRGFNAVQDSFVVKRAWARFTALNEQVELRVGRMPNDWGLGMMLNSGDCLDCDWGMVADRVALTFRAAGHLFTPHVDWVSSGPVYTPFGGNGGPVLDSVTWDDVPEYGVRIMKLTHPEDIREQVLQGDVVLNYGWLNGLRRQSRDLRAEYYGDSFDPSAPVLVPTSTEETSGASPFERRDALIYTSDAYLQLHWGNLELGLEAAVRLGNFKDRTVVNPGEGEEETTIFQLGGALELAYRFGGAPRGPVLSLRGGGASGDPRPGFGALDRADSQRGQRADAATFDRRLTNFQLSPDYHVDLLLFRRIIGTVTDAWYVSPGVSYFFDDTVEGRLNAVYSQTFFERNVPGEALPLGLEFDGELIFGDTPEGERSGLKGSLAGGLLFPFGAFENPRQPENEQGGTFAWTLQGRIYVTF